MNYKQIISLVCAVLLAGGALAGAISGLISWEVAMPSILAGVGVLGIHPKFN